MADRDPYRKMIDTRSAGRGRTITVYWSPLNLRHELDYRGRTINFFCGNRDSSKALALAEALRLREELREDDKTRLYSR